MPDQTSPPHALFIGSRIYRGSIYGRTHPLAIQRVPAVMDLSRALGWLPPDRYLTSPRAKPKALYRFHTEDYISALQAAEASQSVTTAIRERHGLGTLSNPVFPEMFRRPATAAGGGLLAAERVVDGGIIYNPGGGTHHGMADRAAGFCYVNEPVLTIKRLLQMGLSRVAYVDIDAHHGDGVQAAFEGSSQVRVISVHEARRWPGTGLLLDTGGGAAFNLPVSRSYSDTEFDYVLNELLLPAVDGFAPEAIYLQAGADSLTEDPLSRLGLSNLSYLKAVRALRDMAPRFIVSGGGGYNPWSVARCWTAIWGVLSGQDLPDPLPDAGQEILCRLTWTRKAQPGPQMLTTLVDSPRPGPIPDDLRRDVEVLKRRLQTWM